MNFGSRPRNMHKTERKNTRCGLVSFTRFIYGLAFDMSHTPFFMDLTDGLFIAFVNLEI